MSRVLYIEDDQEYAAVITEFLTSAGFNVDYTDKSVTGLEKAKKEDYDIYLIDLYMEVFNGAQIVELIKTYKPDAKIMILTNSASDEDELKLLRTGVDDYVQKNSSFEILLEKVKRLVNKKSYNSLINVLESKSEEINIDLANHVVKKKDEEVSITNTEFDLLVYMLRNPNKLLSRAQIIEDVWGVNPEEYMDLRTIDTHIKNLRSKLSITSIVSIRGLGYRWNE